MNPFNQNFAEELNQRAMLCSGEYDFGKLMCVLKERTRFKAVVELIDKIRAFMSRKEKIHRGCDRDNYFSAGEAVEYGLCDKIIAKQQ